MINDETRAKARDAAQAKADELIDYWDLSDIGHQLERTSGYDAVVNAIVDAALEAAEVS